MWTVGLRPRPSSKPNGRFMTVIGVWLLKVENFEKQTINVAFDESFRVYFDWLQRSVHFGIKILKPGNSIKRHRSQNVDNSDLKNNNVSEKRH